VNVSAFTGKYECKVNDPGFSYIRPQENGYRTDVHTVSSTDEQGFGICVEGGDGTICFNARYNTDCDFDPGLSKKQQHATDIDPRRKLYVNIDLKQRGVGGDDSRGARPMKQYRMPDDVYSYAYTITAVK
jgi:beta-galactosidase